MTPTPEAIIGLELDGQGFKEVNRDLSDTAQGWERIEKYAMRSFGWVDKMAVRVGGLAGAAGIGLLINDLTRLEDVAARASLSVNAIGGRGAYQPYQRQLRGAAIATSQDSRELGAVMTSLQTRVGGGYLNAASRWGTLGRSLGNYGMAYGIDMPTLGDEAEQLTMFGGAGIGQLPSMLQLLAGQARRAGREGQTAQATQAMAGLTAQLGALHGLPASNLRGLSAMYGGAGRGNSMFYDPGMFAAGALGVDQALTHAYANPRMYAALQMAGIPYGWQREGLGGKHGQQMAQRLLGFSERSYGKGTIEQDVFLRSQFGDVSASMLEALAKGRDTWANLQRGPAIPGDQAARTDARSRHTQQTIGANAQKQRERAGGTSDGFIQDVLTSIFGDGGPSVENYLEMTLGVWGVKKFGPKVFNTLKTRAGKAAAEKAAAAALAKAAPVGVDLAAAAGLSEAGGLTARLLGFAGKAAKVGGPVGATVGFLLDPGNLDAGEDQRTFERKAAEVQRRFGAGWQANPAARAWAVKAYGLHTFNQGTQLSKAFGEIFAPSRGATPTVNGKDPLDQFSKSVDQFDKAIRDALGGHSGRTKGASWSGGNAAGLQDANSNQGNNMVLARMIGGGSGGPVVQTAGFPSTTSPGASSPGASPGASPAGGPGGGGGWTATKATWYDANVAARNTGGMGAKPVTSGNRGVAVPGGANEPLYGTAVEIVNLDNGRSIETTIIDSIGGNASDVGMDIRRQDAEALGMIAAGKVNIKWRRTGGGKAKGHSHGASKGSGSGGGHAGAGGGPTVHSAAWMTSPPAAPGAGGAGGMADIHVHVDGRRLEQQRRLVRGRA